MKKSVVLSISVLVLAAGLVYVLWPDAPQGQPVGETTASPNADGGVGETGNAGPGASEGSSPATRPGVVPPALSAPTLGQAFARLQDAEVSEGERAYLRMHAARLCAQPPGLHKSVSEPAARSARALSESTLRSFTGRFCADFTGDWGDELSTFDELKIEDPVIEAYEFATEVYELPATPEAAEARQAGIDYLASLASGTEGGIERLVAAQALQQVGFVSPELEAFSKSNGWALSADELLTAQTLAVQLSMCDRYGGCGAQQATTMLQCSLYASCNPTASAMDVWRRQYSPAVIEAATAIRRKRT